MKKVLLTIDASMLRFIIVNLVHSVIKYSDRIKKKYISIVRRLGKNRAIIALECILVESIYTMLVNEKEFIDRLYVLIERKMNSMKSMGIRPFKIPAIENIMN